MLKNILLLLIIIFFSVACFIEDSNRSKLELYPEKFYSLDINGRIESTDIFLTDFDSSKSCKNCHETHYEEWSRSMHAYSMKDPIFIQGWLKEQEDHPETGERFCIQCHSPTAFVTGEYFNNIGSSSYLSPIISEGISCDFCHSVTNLSSTIHTPDNVAAVAEYHINPGENIKYGSIEDPQNNTYHDSQYHPIFKRSEFCLPCHNMTVRNVEAEMTFTEWRRIPGNDMGDLNSCQSCHMPRKFDGTHNHEFVGVDIDLTNPPSSSIYQQQYNSVLNLLQNAAILNFGGLNDVISRVVGDSLLLIPISITCKTQHALPSGTSFTREAWLEVKVINSESGEILFSSGLIDNKSDLDTNDNTLLLFTSYLLDENGDTTNSVSKVHEIIKQMLPASPSRYHVYNFFGDFSSINILEINVKMKFRSFKPHLLRQDHPELLENLPVFEMISIKDTLHL